MISPEVINALRAKSGESGLSAFLPPHDKIYKSAWDDGEDDTLTGIDVEAIARMDTGNYDTDSYDDDVESRSTDADSGSSSQQSDDSDSDSASNHQFPTFSPPPHLPLISHFEEGDFSIAEVLPPKGRTDVRAWTLQLLQRYRFVLGQTPTRFDMITSLNDARNKMRQTDKDKNAVSGEFLFSVGLWNAFSPSAVSLLSRFDHGSNVVLFFFFFFLNSGSSLH